jgi:hypothetical protein
VDSGDDRYPTIGVGCHWTLILGPASALIDIEPFLLHVLLFRGDKVEKRIAGDVDEAMRREQLFDLLARPAADKPEPVADRGVFGAPAGVVEPLWQGADISLAVDNDEPPARSQHANPFVHSLLRVRQCPQEVPADGNIEAGGSKGQLLVIGLFVAHHGLALGRLLARLCDH